MRKRWTDHRAKNWGSSNVVFIKIFASPLTRMTATREGEHLRIATFSIRGMVLVLLQSNKLPLYELNYVSIFACFLPSSFASTMISLRPFMFIAGYQQFFTNRLSWNNFNSQLREAVHHFPHSAFALEQPERRHCLSITFFACCFCFAHPYCFKWRIVFEVWSVPFIRNRRWINTGREQERYKWSSSGIRATTFTGAGAVVLGRKSQGSSGRIERQCQSVDNSA